MTLGTGVGGEAVPGGMDPFSFRAERGNGLSCANFDLQTGGQMCPDVVRVSASQAPRALNLILAGDAGCCSSHTREEA